MWPPTCASSRSATTTSSTSGTCPPGTRWRRSWSGFYGTSAGISEAATLLRLAPAGSDCLGEMQVDGLEHGDAQLTQVLRVGTAGLVAEGGTQAPAEREDTRQQKKHQPQRHSQPP